MNTFTNCDRCGDKVTALVVVSNGMADLAFCGHHFAEYDFELRAQGFVIVDDVRELIQSGAEQ